LAYHRHAAAAVGVTCALGEPRLLEVAGNLVLAFRQQGERLPHVEGLGLPAQLVGDLVQAVGLQGGGPAQEPRLALGVAGEEGSLQVQGRLGEQQPLDALDERTKPVQHDLLLS
jgi:hypothetical protein